MFSKPLFKQSCKTNGVLWLVITVAVCFMLSCVMLITGRGTISSTKSAIQNTIIDEEIESFLERKAIGYYDIGISAMEYFDEVYLSEYQKTLISAIKAGMPQEQAAALAGQKAYASAVKALQDTFIPQLISSLGYDEDSDEAKEVQGVVFYTLNPMQQDGTFMYDSFYQEHGENVIHYTDLLAGITDSSHAGEREKYVMTNVSAFLAGNMTSKDNVEKMVDALESYGVTEEKYNEFGYSDYANLKEIAQSAIVDYRANLEYRLENLKTGESAESIKEELKNEISNSLLARLPEEVSDALEEVGKMDMYGILVGSIFFKMAGLLLPIIYMIMTSNALIAGQVDSGSMAYILSTSIKRHTVTFTQAVYLVGSLLLMFTCTAVTSIICLNIADVSTSLDWKKLLLINLGAFLVLFALGGFCFMMSCWFDRSRRAMAIGGGISMFFLVATMLGLFGSPILPSIVRIEALNYFNYVSLITLFDPISILDGTTAFIWKFAVLAAVGLVCYIAGSIRFRKRNLPL